MGRDAWGGQSLDASVHETPTGQSCVCSGTSSAANLSSEPSTQAWFHIRHNRRYRWGTDLPLRDGGLASLSCRDNVERGRAASFSVSSDCVKRCDVGGRPVIFYR